MKTNMKLGNFTLQIAKTMKQNKLSFLLTMLMSMVGIKAFAYYDTKVNGIYYSFSLSNATVTNGADRYNSWNGSNSYRGTIVIPKSITYNGKTYSVTSIDYEAFYDCSALTSITIPNSVTSIGNRAFKGCSGLTSVSIPNSVTSIGDGVFSGCSGLTSVTIPNSVTSIGGFAFSGCSALKSVTIPNSVTEIGGSAFQSCSALTSVTIPNSVTSIGNWAFKGCKKLTAITISNRVTSIGESTFSDCIKLTSVTIPNSVTEIGGSAFAGCKKLTAITIPNRVTSIGENAFYGCSGLTSVTIPNKVTSIGDNAFYGCSNLLFVTIGNKVNSIGKDAFHDCNALTTVNISDLVAWCSISFHPYGWQSTINNVVTNGFDVSSNPLSIAKHLYINGKEVKNLVIPDGVQEIQQCAFYNCVGLTSVTIPKTVTAIHRNAFGGCNALSSVKIVDLSAWCNISFSMGGSNLESSNPLSIAKHLFMNGKEVKDLVIPDDVQYIQPYAFSNCEGLTSVTIPRTVKGIKDFAFYDCYGLKTVKTMVRTPFAINWSVFSGSYDYAILYVPSGTKYKYQTQGNSWSKFDMIEEMPEERPVIVKAKNYTIEYGESLPKFKYTCEGGNLEGEPKITCKATKTSPVGTYPIVISKGSISNTGDVTLVNGTLTIVKAPLTVVGGEYTKYLGEKNPKFEPSYRGFKNKERDDVLTTKPTAKTKAKKSSPVGTYDVVFSGAKAKNYDIEYEKGTLTIKDEPYFTENGIKYANLFKNNTVKIIDSDDIKGDYVIQGTVKHNGINFTVTSIEGNAFAYSDMTSVSIPSTVKSIGSDAFYSSSLKSVKIPSSVTTIGQGAFSFCYNLLSVDIPKGVKSIGKGAFRSCRKLSSVIVRGKPIFKEYAFGNCEAITSVTSHAEEPEKFYSDDIVFESSIYTNATLYVPTGKKSTYKKTTGWSLFKKIDDSAKIKLNKSQAIIQKGKTITLKATVYPSSLSNKKVTWKSSNKKVAKVSSKGKVTGVKAGTATITCTSNATGLKTTCKVTVGYVKLDKTEASVKTGKTVTLKATVYPSSLSDKSVTWESSNKKIATVTSVGKVKGMKAGTVTITCTSKATGLSATCTVTVKASSSTRSLDGDDDEVTGIEDEIMDDPAVVEPFDVYDLSGRKVRHQVTSLDGLPNGIYIVNGKKILKKD
ncbi:MAG: leucine-rich repeat protein [Prevotella sp.]|nr:leucine-rich repeat protein [Prevotella sp.]